MEHAKKIEIVQKGVVKLLGKVTSADDKILNNNHIQIMEIVCKEENIDAGKKHTYERRALKVAVNDECERFLVSFSKQLRKDEAARKRTAEPVDGATHNPSASFKKAKVDSTSDVILPQDSRCAAKDKSRVSGVPSPKRPRMIIE